MSDAGGDDDDALTLTSSQREAQAGPPRWDRQHCEILKRWSELSASYKWLHDRAFAAVSTTHRRFSIPIIILSTLCGSASLSTSSLPAEYQTLAPSVIGLVSLSTGILGTVAEFLRVSERVEGHRMASLGFGSLARSIRAELSLPVIDRSCHGAEFISKCRETLDSLHQDSPVIPMAIIKKFGKAFRRDDSFQKPDLLQISPCTIFDDVAARVEAEAKVQQSVVDAAAARAATTAAETAARYAVREERRLSHARDVGASNVGRDLDVLVGNLVGARRRAEQVSIDIEDGLREDDEQSQSAEPAGKPMRPAEPAAQAQAQPQPQPPAADDEESVHSSEEREIAQLQAIDKGARGGGEQ